MKNYLYGSQLNDMNDQLVHTTTCRHQSTPFYIIHVLPVPFQQD